MNNKFRAWDNERKQWLATVEPVGTFRFEQDIESSLLNDEARKAIEFSRFTGFQDSNGKDIYFDDIVKYVFYDPDHEESYEAGTALIVENMTNGVGLLRDLLGSAPDKTWAVDEGGAIEDYWDDEDLWTIEVIGNRFDTPDLIKPCIACNTE